jgi:molybdopterin/thiamine biosynthesis adenylyltransferase
MPEALNAADAAGRVELRPDDPASRARTRDTLVFPARELSGLRETLLAESPLETARFLLARPVRTPSGAWRLVVYDVIDVTPEEYSVRTGVAIQLPPSVVAKVMQRARLESASIVTVHSHPLADAVHPSSHDIDGERVLLPAFRSRVPDVPHARLIVGPSAVHATLFDVAGGERVLDVVEVGANVVFADVSRTREREVRYSGTPDGRYDRQVRAFGEQGQRQLADLRVAVVGLGGTGSAVAQQLAYLGVGSFVLIDPDAIETTNLNRVVGARHGDVGRAKVDVARDMITGINPSATVLALRADVRDRSTARHILDADIFLVCTDSQGSRAVLSQIAYQYLVPAVDVGVAIHAQEGGVTHVSGRVQMLAPGLPCLLCSEVLDPEEVRRDLLTAEARAADPYIVGAPTPQPAVVSINSTASSLAVTMLLSAITGVPYATRNQRLRLELGVVTRIELDPRVDCPICSVRGSLAKGDSWPMPGRVS